MPHPNESLRVLITGAGGRIGRTLRDGLAERYTLLRLADIAPQDEAGPGEEVVTCDVADAAAVARAVAGIDVIVHLAAVPDEDAWEKLLPANISGTYNVFEAARLAGVRRVIFASSNHAVGFHRRARPLDEHDVPRPDSRYGVTKVFGEAVGRLYADKHALQVASLRIGSFQERPRDRRQLMTWISPGDMVRLVGCAIEAPDYHYITLYGVSANTRATWWTHAADLIGYRPEDDAEAWADDLMTNAPAEHPVALQFHGGPTCVVEFDGEPGRID